MLKELLCRPDGQLRRRYFDDDWLEVFVWLDDTNQIVGFKLCYDRHEGELAVTWRKDEGFELSPVHHGEETSLYGRSQFPVEIDLPIPFAMLLQEWQARSAQIDPEVAAIIEARLRAAVT